MGSPVPKETQSTPPRGVQLGFPETKRYYDFGVGQTEIAVTTLFTSRMASNWIRMASLSIPKRPKYTVFGGENDRTVDG